MVIARPTALFDPYTEIAAPDEVVNVTKKRGMKENRVAVPSVVEQLVPSAGINKAGGV